MGEFEGFGGEFDSWGGCDRDLELDRRENITGGDVPLVAFTGGSEKNQSDDPLLMVDGQQKLAFAAFVGG